MAYRKATGVLARFAFALDGPSPRFGIGQAGLDTHVITRPAAGPTAAAGAAGNLTGTFIWRVAFGAEDGTMTDPGPASCDTFTGVGLNDMVFSGLFTGDTWSIAIDTAAGTDTFKWRKNGGAWTLLVPITGAAQLLSDGVYVTFAATTGHTLTDAWGRAAGTTLSAKIGALSVIPTSADAKCDRRLIERGTVGSDGTVTWAICGTIYSATTPTVFSDNVAALDASYVTPSVNMTGANGGFVALEPDSSDLAPDFGLMPVAAMKGSAGKPRNIPGGIKIGGAPKITQRNADLFPFLTTGAGKPDSITRVASEPTVISVWNATTARRTPRSMTGLVYEGSPDVSPTMLYDLVTEEIQFAFANGKITEVTPKLVGCNYGICGWGVKVSGTGTWKGTFVLLGQRYDALAATDAIRFKITAALASHAIQGKITRGSGGAYTGATYTIHTDPTSERQMPYGAQQGDGIEIADEAGYLLGADVGSNRQPLLLLATAPITAGLLVDDVYEFAPTIPIPGTGAAPYSGFPAFVQRAPRLTDAHVAIYKDGTLIEATSGTLTLKWPRKEVTSLGPTARNLNDLPYEGFSEVDLSLVRYLDGTDYRQTQRTDGRAAFQVLMQGERIPVNPGVLSTYREGLSVVVPQMAYTSVKTPVPGQVLVVETINASAEQPDNTNNDVYTLTHTSRIGWRLPSV